MKKISFEKFRIAEIKGLSRISGGNGGDGTDTGKVETPKCVENSTKIIVEGSN